MNTTEINLYSMDCNDIKNFLISFYEKDINTNNSLTWNIKYNNPIEMVDMIGVFIDNSEKYKITMWVCLDQGVYININETNSDKIIRYLFERYPY